MKVWNGVTTAIGLLFRSCDGGDHRQYLGTCFSLGSPEIFITAAHCVRGLERNQILVNHHGAAGPNLLSRIRELEILEHTDIAMFSTDAPRAKWVRPFQKVRFANSFGEEVASLGFPEQSSPAGWDPRPTMRAYRGYIHRPLAHTTPRASEAYSAYEVSFPCPGGLSGRHCFFRVHLMLL